LNILKKLYNYIIFHHRTCPDSNDDDDDASENKTSGPLSINSNQDGVYYITLEDNTTGSHRSSFNVQLAVAGDLDTRFKVFTNGNGGIIMGNNQRIVLSEDGLTLQRTYTLPDSTTQLIGTTDTATVTNKTFDKFIIGPVTSTPPDPSTDYSKIYIKTLDQYNDGIFALIKRNGVFTEVQIL
jgi:hypothetical protein